MVIETTRLILRELTADDFESLYRILADPDIMRYYPRPFDETQVRNWITRNRERYRIFGFGLWAVCLKETGNLIGDCGLTMQLIGGQIKPEIGYHIHTDHQRKGYGTEAAIAVRDWTFRNTPFNMVYSYMKYTNIASQATAAAAGLKKIKEYPDPEDKILHVYAISREEWNGLRKEAGSI